MEKLKGILNITNTTLLSMTSSIGSGDLKSMAYERVVMDVLTRQNIKDSKRAGDMAERNKMSASLSD